MTRTAYVIIMAMLLPVLLLHISVVFALGIEELRKGNRRLGALLIAMPVVVAVSMPWFLL